jgi:hypothetical protein
MDLGAEIPPRILRDLADDLARVLVPDLVPSESQHFFRMLAPASGRLFLPDGEKFRRRA